MANIGPDQLPSTTRMTVVDLLDRLVALLDDFERELDEPHRREVAWARVTAAFSALDEVLRDEAGVHVAGEQFVRHEVQVSPADG
jgi:hypothetical protein